VWLGCCYCCWLIFEVVLGGPQADTSPEKNYAVEIPPKEYSPGITALQGLAQCKSLLPLGSPVIMTTGKPP
ncbi:unnamed protein product, partial [Pylaiella littoralis]